MASPQLENGFTEIANEILEALSKTRIPGEARQVLDVIIRLTYGWGKKSDHISLSQFVKCTNLRKPTVCRAINKLKDMNIIVIKKDNERITSYSFNKNYETWKSLSKKITLSKKIISVIEKDNLPLSLLRHTKESITKETITKESVARAHEEEKGRFCDGNSISATEKRRGQVDPYGKFGNVLLTDAEVEELEREYGKDKTTDYIERVGFSMESKGTKYKNHYATILDWMKKDGIKSRTESKPKPKEVGRMTMTL